MTRGAQVDRRVHDFHRSDFRETVVRSPQYEKRASVRAAIAALSIHQGERIQVRIAIEIRQHGIEIVGGDGRVDFPQGGMDGRCLFVVRGFLRPAGQ